MSGIEGEQAKQAKLDSKLSWTAILAGIQNLINSTLGFVPHRQPTPPHNDYQQLS